MSEVRAGVAILIPVLRRPQNAAPVLRSIEAATPEPFRAIFICDHHDEVEQAAVRAAGGYVYVVTGSYAQKMNAGISATDEPLIFLGADDVRFHPGWLEAAARRMEGPIGIVGTNDLGNPRVTSGDHSTHTLVSRAYAERGSIDDPTVFLHEGYRHNFPDDEMIGTAKHCGAWAHALDSIVEHLHPHWGKANRDEVYDLGDRNFAHDRKLFLSRRWMWAKGRDT